MRLAKLVANLGYGSQKDVRAMIRAGRLTLASGEPVDAESQVEHDQVRLDGDPLDPAPGMVLMMNKPVGFTCSTSDPGRIIYELLPPRFLRRKPIVSPVGRLDRDTSGLLLLTDDGAFLHRVISPRNNVPKTYEVTLASPLRGDEAGILAAGTLVLRSENEPLAPAVLTVLSPTTARVSITEGRYHQVRRMFAALGNHVAELRRIGIGALEMDGLEPGKWRPLAPDEIARVFQPRP